MFDEPPKNLFDTRLLVSVAFHYKEEKLRYLAQVIRSLSDIMVARLDLDLITNSDSAEEIRNIERLCRYFLPPERYVIRRFPNLPDPQWLVWCHKETVLRDRFVNGDEGFTHFLYLEDDIGFTHRNLAYFLTAREYLRPYDLMPTFHRVEYNTNWNTYVSVDHTATSYIKDVKRIELPEFSFLCSTYAYCAMYLLDHEMAAEHIACPSFDREGSRSLIWWATLERANLALCFSRIPEGFVSRYVIPVGKRTMEPLPACWVTHIGDKYAHADGPHGKISMHDLFWWSREGKFPPAPGI